jgi:hypothetical protein
MFDPSKGMTSLDSSPGELFVLTTHRIIYFSQTNNGSNFSVIPLNKIDGFTRERSNSSKNTELYHNDSRSPKSLYQGLSFIFAGILSYLVLGYNSSNLTIAITMGITLGLLGFLFVGRYLVHKFDLLKSYSEEDQDLVLSAGSISLKLTCTNKQSRDQIPAFINSIMRTRANT